MCLFIIYILQLKGVVEIREDIKKLKNEIIGDYQSNLYSMECGSAGFKHGAQKCIDDLTCMSEYDLEKNLESDKSLNFNKTLDLMDSYKQSHKGDKIEFDGIGASELEISKYHVDFAQGYQMTMQVAGSQIHESMSTYNNMIDARSKMYSRQKSPRETAESLFNI